MDWKHLFTSFEGRISRSGFWAGIGVIVAILIAAVLIDSNLGSDHHWASIPWLGGMGVLSLIVLFASVFFALAIYAKRWHDRDKSGWWSLIAVVPVVGGIWFIIELGLLAGTKGPNRFGSDPSA